MNEEKGTTGHPADDPGILVARERLGRAVIGFNRHANLVERFRASLAQFRASRATFESGAVARASLREAREHAALHRAAVRNAVGDFVRLMRDAGLPPERVLVAVKRQLTLSVTVETPGAPSIDASQLETDASLWAIKAYFEAA